MTKAQIHNAAIVIGLLVIAMTGGQAASQDSTQGPTDWPKVGAKAPDFALQNIAGQTVKLGDLLKKSHVVLVVLRGYPGYQCPICNQQVGGLLQQADKIEKAGTQVVFVYPGPAASLVDRAKEFVADRTVPKHFYFVVDPDYQFTNAYSLRWDAPRETAYPATFVINRGGEVRFAKVSKTHGGRTDSKTVLAELSKLAASKQE